MARKTFEKIYSDLSGDELDENSKALSFAFDGVQYEIDVTDAEREQLASALASFIDAGRRVTGRSSARKSTSSSSPSGHDPKTVRAWAADNKVDVPSRGRIPAAVLEAYEKAN